MTLRRSSEGLKLNDLRFKKQCDAHVSVFAIDNLRYTGLALRSFRSLITFSFSLTSSTSCLSCLRMHLYVGHLHHGAHYTSHNVHGAQSIISLVHVVGKRDMDGRRSQDGSLNSGGVVKVRSLRLYPFLMTMVRLPYLTSAVLRGDMHSPTRHAAGAPILGELPPLSPRRQGECLWVRWQQNGDLPLEDPLMESPPNHA